MKYVFHDHHRCDVEDSRGAVTELPNNPECGQYSSKFGWGGSDDKQSMQLAVCLLAHATGSIDLAREHGQRFADEKIGPQMADTWELTLAAVELWLSNVVGVADTVVSAPPTDVAEPEPETVCDDDPSTDDCEDPDPPAEGTSGDTVAEPTS